jgi:hypothetical protein
MESAEMNQRVKETEEDSNEEENGVDEDINGLGGVPTPPDSPQNWLKTEFKKQLNKLCSSHLF